jgi:septal ring factor EnvC (AmiA/AmiB activator)
MVNMVKWIRENSFLFTIGSTLVLIISAGAVANHQLSGLVAQQSEVQQHIHDNVRHIDPVRDKQAWQQLLDRIDKLEDKVRQIEGKRTRSRRRGR